MYAGVCYDRDGAQGIGAAGLESRHFNRVAEKARTMFVVQLFFTNSELLWVRLL